MPAVARVNVDLAGGLITGNLAPAVFVNGSPVAVAGAAIAAHGDSPHAAAVMAAGSPTVYAGGIPVCRFGDPATCNHVAGPGSANVFADEGFAVGSLLDINLILDLSPIA